MCIMLFYDNQLGDAAKHLHDKCKQNMMTSSNRNIFRVTGPLCVEFTGHRCSLFEQRAGFLSVFGWQNVALTRLGSVCTANTEYNEYYLCGNALDGITHMGSHWATRGVGAGANFTVTQWSLDNMADTSRTVFPYAHGFMLIESYLKLSLLVQLIIVSATLGTNDQ